MKRLPFIAALVVAMVSFGDTFRTNSVEGLVYLLKRYNGGGHTVELESGEYNFTESSSWFTNANHTSHIYLSKIRLKGVGGDRESVKLIGCGKLRVIQADSQSVVENLTITNGCAVAVAGSDTSYRGGGIYGGATITNCVIIGNRAEKFGGGGGGDARFFSCLIKNNVSEGSGGGFHRCYATDCRIEGNEAKNNGGGGYTMHRLIDCEIIGNVAETGVGAGGYEITYATNCIFADNRAYNTSGYGGGISNNSNAKYKSVICHSTVSNNYSAAHAAGAYGVTMTNCIVTMNHADKSCGGVSSSDLFNCEVTFNSANCGNGGGVHLSMVSNCTVYANICSNLSVNSKGEIVHGWGGGLYDCTAYDSRICGNCAMSCVDANGDTHVGTAGGVANSTLYDCDVYGNYADSHCGGVRASTLVRCSVAGNCGGAGSDGWSAYACNLIDCDVSGGTLYSCAASGTKFRDIGKAVTLTGNPYKETTAVPVYIMKGCANMTNCLFVGNGTKGVAETSFLQYATVENKTSSFVNCTIVSNIYDWTFTYAKAAYPVKMVNCVLFGNEKRDGTKSDISMVYEKSSSACATNSVCFHNCAYGIRSTNGGLDWGIYPQESMYVFGNESFGDDPKFQHHRDAKHPFALRRTSPLIGRGRYEPWMAETTDLRGEGFARANGRSVDIGCYQCWLNPAGTVFSIR